MSDILVVDDSRTIRNSLKKMFEDLGYEVVTAEDGKEGLNVLEREKNLKLVVVDIHMPVMNGLEMMEKVHQLKKEGNLFPPMFVLTTESDKAMMEKANRLGALGWLKKPFKPKELVTFVKTVLKDDAA